MHVKPEIERFAKIRVIGVGGAGGNVINSMIESQQITVLNLLPLTRILKIYPLIKRT